MSASSLSAVAPFAPALNGLSLTYCYGYAQGKDQPRRFKHVAQCLTLALPSRPHDAEYSGNRVAAWKNTHVGKTLHRYTASISATIAPRCYPHATLLMPVPMARSSLLAHVAARATGQQANPPIYTTLATAIDPNARRLRNKPCDRPCGGNRRNGPSGRPSLRTTIRVRYSARANGRCDQADRPSDTPA